MSPIEALLQRYEHSPPSVRRRGRSWYPQCRGLLAAIAAEYGRTLPQTAAVFAITSANTQLAANLRFTEQILRGERKAGCYPTFQAPLIEAALETRYPGRFVRGPKCSTFYKAIMGETDALVLDRWAARAAGIDRGQRRDLNATTRRSLDVAYREAAKMCGETVRAFQAIVWIAVRESTPNGRAVIPRLADITR